MRFGRSTLVMAALAAGTALATPAHIAAQEVRDLDTESSNMRSFSGALGAEPVQFSVTLPAMTTMRIEAIATSELDPVLRVYNAKSGELIGENDDGGDNLNSRLTVQDEEGMLLRIEVDSFSYEGFEGEDGFEGARTFDLRLTSNEYNPQDMRKVTWESTESGTLFGGETHEFRFEGEEGILLEVAMLADGDADLALDPYLSLLDSSGEEVAMNDDGAGELNSLLRYVMTDDGPYTIVASGLGDSAGSYTLRVGKRREPVVQAPVQVIGVDDRATGRLGVGYENGGIEPNSIDYQLSEAAIAAIRAGAGEVTITMEAVDGDDADFVNSLDPYIELGFETPLGFAVVMSDDDGAGELDAMLPVDLSDIAEDEGLLSALRIRVTGFGQSSGDYALSVSEGMQAQEALEEFVNE